MQLKFYDLSDEEECVTLPALIGRVKAGHPTMTYDLLEPANLLYLLRKGINNPLLVEVEGDSMVNDVKDGDWVIVEQGALPSPGDIILASVNGEHTIKRYQPSNSNGTRKLHLVPSNTEYKAREVTADQEFRVIGIVRKILQNVR